MRTSLHSAHRPWLVALAGLLTLAACESSTAPATGATASTSAVTKKIGGQQLVPFSDRESFQAAGGAIVCGPLGPLPAIYVGSGVSSHLGRATSVVTWQQCGLIAGQLVAMGTATTTAANGDQMTFAFTQTFTALVPGVSSEFRLDVTIVGGTGRFAGVTGFGTGQGTTTGPALQGEWELDGWMTPPGVSKHANP